MRARIETSKVPTEVVLLKRTSFYGKGPKPISLYWHSPYMASYSLCIMPDDFTLSNAYCSGDLLEHWSVKSSNVLVGLLFADDWPNTNGDEPAGVLAVKLKPPEGVPVLVLGLPNWKLVGMVLDVSPAPLLPKLKPPDVVPVGAAPNIPAVVPKINTRIRISRQQKVAVEASTYRTVADYQDLYQQYLNQI